MEADPTPKVLTEGPLECNHKTDSDSTSQASLNSNENSQDSGADSKKSTPQPSNHIINIEEIDSETMKKMKGDAIGETLYSERFVLKTLMELKNQNGAKIDDSFEKDLCLLWDVRINNSLIAEGFRQVLAVLDDD